MPAISTGPAQPGQRHLGEGAPQSFVTNATETHYSSQPEQRFDTRSPFPALHSTMVPPHDIPRHSRAAAYLEASSAGSGPSQAFNPGLPEGAPHISHGPARGRPAGDTDNDLRKRRRVYQVPHERLPDPSSGPQ